MAHVGEEERLHYINAGSQYICIIICSRDARDKLPCPGARAGGVSTWMIISRNVDTFPLLCLSGQPSGNQGGGHAETSDQPP